MTMRIQRYIPHSLLAGVILAIASCKEEIPEPAPKEPVTVVVDTSYILDPLQGFQLEDLLPELRTNPYIDTDLNNYYVFSFQSDTTHVPFPLDLIHAAPSENVIHRSYTGSREGNKWVFLDRKSSVENPFIISHFQVPETVRELYSGGARGRLTVRIHYDSSLPFSRIYFDSYDAVILPFVAVEQREDGPHTLDRIEMHGKYLPKEGLEMTFDLKSMALYWVRKAEDYDFESTVKTLSRFTASEADLEREIGPDEILEPEIHYEFILSEVEISPALVAVTLPTTDLKPVRPEGLPAFLTDYPVVLPKVDASLYANYDGLVQYMDLTGTFKARQENGEVIQANSFRINHYSDRNNGSYWFGKNGRDIHDQFAVTVDNLSDLYAHPFPTEWTLEGLEYPTEITVDTRTGKTYDLAFAFGHRAMLILSSGLEGLRLVRNLGRIQIETLKVITFTDATVRVQATNEIPMEFQLEARILDAAGNPVPGISVTCPRKLIFGYPPVRREVEFRLHCDRETQLENLFLECTFTVDAHGAVALVEGQTLSFSEPFLDTTAEVIKYQ